MKTCPHCDSPLDDDPKGSPRSPDQLRRYFAGISAKYQHWPESHPQQFSNETEFRKWIQVKAGHREIGARVDLLHG